MRLFTIMTLIVGMSALLIDGISGSQVRRLEGPRQYQCNWAPEVLTLTGWRGKVAVRTYHFSNRAGVKYSVKRAAYRQCRALPRPPASKELVKARKTNTTLWWFFGALLVFWLMTGLEQSEGEISYKRRNHFLREYEAEERRRRDDARRKEVERVEAEREKSRIAHEERLARKAKRRAEHEARRQANEARKAAHVAKWESNHGR